MVRCLSMPPTKATFWLLPTCPIALGANRRRLLGSRLEAHGGRCRRKTSTSSVACRSAFLLYRATRHYVSFQRFRRTLLVNRAMVITVCRHTIFGRFSLIRSGKKVPSSISPKNCSLFCGQLMNLYSLHSHLSSRGPGHSNFYLKWGIKWISYQSTPRFATCQGQTTSPSST